MAESAAIHVVTDDTFNTLLSQSKLVLVEFGATWCEPCKTLDPIVEAVATERAGHLSVFRIDVDAGAETAARFGVRGVPTLLLLKNGQMVERLVGMQAKAKVLSMIDKHNKV